MTHAEILDEARERVPGNAAAMLEALDAALRFLGNLEIEPYSPLDEDANELRQKIMAALASPSRQCDVGTAEEQSKRFRSYCLNHSSASDVDMECCRCPLEKVNAMCELAWGQTSYDERGAK